MSAYHDGWAKYGKVSKWIIHLDIDEYPVNPALSARGFLLTTIEAIRERYRTKWPRGIGTIHLRNMGFLGWPDDSQVLLIDRLRNCTREPMTSLSKPINLVEGTMALEMHRPNRHNGYGEVGDSGANIDCF